MNAPKLRLAFARINQETNALSPVKTTVADFESVHWFKGDELLAMCAPTAMEVPSMFKNAELSGFVQAMQRMPDVELVPLMSAWATPSGPLTRSCFEALCDDLCGRLAGAGQLDGLYLSLHGAMGVDGMDDPEGEIVRRVRATLAEHGQESLPLVVSYDLHGNLTRAVAEGVDALVAYATNPHRDHRRCGARAGRILYDTVLKRARPTTAWRSLPMLLGGGTTLDFWPPLLSIFRRMRKLERRGEVLSASLLTCHPWNKNPETGWSVVVVTDGDQDKAERLADELAEAAWATRHVLPPTFVSAQDAVARAKNARLRRKLGAVVLADASDVVSAGAPGENTELLRVLVEQGQGMLCYVPLRDPALVEELWDAPLGARRCVAIGGKLDPSRTRPLEAEVTVLSKTQAHGVDRALVLGIGTVRACVVEGVALAMRPAFFSTLGLDPWKADVIVVKNFFPFRMFFLPLARLTMYVRTSGVTDFDAAFQLRFAGPVHPKDPIDDWHEADRRRHALPFAPPDSSAREPRAA
ncbi:MAG: M81 family metallopeptidase [Deltaproteobacteria bacterium]|nr:M81 family metallopeptidase [Deltaproteobacteria bacterium]